MCLWILKNRLMICKYISIIAVIYIIIISVLYHPSSKDKLVGVELLAMEANNKKEEIDTTYLKCSKYPLDWSSGIPNVIRQMKTKNCKIEYTPNDQTGSYDDYFKRQVEYVFEHRKPVPTSNEKINSFMWNSEESVLYQINPCNSVHDVFKKGDLIKSVIEDYIIPYYNYHYSYPRLADFEFLYSDFFQTTPLFDLFDIDRMKEHSKKEIEKAYAKKCSKYPLEWSKGEQYVLTQLKKCQLFDYKLNKVFLKLIYPNSRLL